MPEVKVIQSSMKLLPPPDGYCRICAIDHPPHFPHNAQSLFFQMRFQMRYKRPGTWADALAHCAPEMQSFWRSRIEDMGAWSEPPEGVDPISEPIDG